MPDKRFKFTQKPADGTQNWQYVTCMRHEYVTCLSM